jgi:hypothetical protein
VNQTNRVHSVSTLGEAGLMTRYISAAAVATELDCGITSGLQRGAARTWLVELEGKGGFSLALALRYGLNVTGKGTGVLAHDKYREKAEEGVRNIFPLDRFTVRGDTLCIAQPTLHEVRRPPLYTCVCVLLAWRSSRITSQSPTHADGDASACGVRPAPVDGVWAARERRVRGEGRGRESHPLAPHPGSVHRPCTSCPQSAHS